MTIGEYIRLHQPDEYAKLLMFANRDKLTDADIRKLMSHDSYVREHGVVRQVRHAE